MHDQLFEDDLALIHAGCCGFVEPAVAQSALGLPMVLPLALLASFLITGAGQVLKLCVDSSIQLDVADEARLRSAPTS